MYLIISLHEILVFRKRNSNKLRHFAQYPIRNIKKLEAYNGTIYRCWFLTPCLSMQAINFPQTLLTLFLDSLKSLEYC